MAFSPTNINTSCIQPQPRRTTFLHCKKKEKEKEKEKNTITTCTIKFHFVKRRCNTNVTTATQFFAISRNTNTDTSVSKAAHPQPTPSPSPSSSTSASWAEFAKTVSGEWDGFGADFNKHAKPIELPESVVPEAYREWEVKVFDWQTQCPTLALPHQLATLSYKLIRLLPTVGCEADAATRYSIHERNIDQVSAFAYQSSGCYIAVWPVEDHNNNATHTTTLEVEHCLIDPRDKESRMRIIQVLRLINHKLELQSMRVFCEQWYGPFRNGDQLGGCAIRDSAFASTQALESWQVIGAWQGLNAVASFQNSQTNMIQELGDESVHKLVRDERDLWLLPKQLWCCLRESEDGGGETCCEAGWLLHQDAAITSRCIFSSNGELKEIRVACETRV